MGTPAGMENRLVKQAGYPIVTVNISGVRGKGAFAWLVLPMRILVAFWQSTVAIFRIRPDVVLSMGGYVAFPGGMMAALWGKPLVVHEPGAVAGIANRTLAPVADRVIVGMEGAFDRPVAQKWANALPKPGRVEWLGTPVRADIRALPAAGAALRRPGWPAATAGGRRKPRGADHERPRARGDRGDAARGSPAGRAPGRREALRGAARRLREGRA